MTVKDIYLIKDLARITGLSIYTIKYYLNLGLIKEIGRSRETNFRYFDSSTAAALNRIISYKRKGMSLNKILDVLKDKEQNI